MAQPFGLNFRVADPSRLFEGSEGLVFPPLVGRELIRCCSASTIWPAGDALRMPALDNLLGDGLLETHTQAEDWQLGDRFRIAGT